MVCVAELCSAVTDADVGAVVAVLERVRHWPPPQLLPGLDLLRMALLSPRVRAQLRASAALAPEPLFGFLLATAGPSPHVTSCFTAGRTDAGDRSQRRREQPDAGPARLCQCYRHGGQLLQRRYDPPGAPVSKMNGGR